MGRMRGLRGSKGAAPRIVLFSPIAQLGPLAMDHPWMVKRNEQLARVETMMRNLAQLWAVAYVDLYTPSLGWGAESVDATGFQLNAAGMKNLNQVLAANNFQVDIRADYPFEAMRASVRKKQQQWYHRYRAVNGFYIYGGRKDPFGVISFPGEMARLDALVDLYDQALWAVPLRGQGPESVDLGQTPPPARDRHQLQKADQSPDPRRTTGDLRSRPRILHGTGCLGDRLSRAAKPGVHDLRHPGAPVGFHHAQLSASFAGHPAERQAAHLRR